MSFINSAGSSFQHEKKTKEIKTKKKKETKQNKSNIPRHLPSL